MPSYTPLSKVKLARGALCACQSFTDPWTRTSLLVRQTHHGKSAWAAQGHLARQRRKDISLASFPSSNAWLFGTSSKRKWNSVIIVNAPLSLAIGSRQTALQTRFRKPSPRRVGGGRIHEARPGCVLGGLGSVAEAPSRMALAMLGPWAFSGSSVRKRRPWTGEICQHLTSSSNIRKTAHGIDLLFHPGRRSKPSSSFFLPLAIEIDIPTKRASRLFQKPCLCLLGILSSTPTQLRVSPEAAKPWEPCWLSDGSASLRGRFCVILRQDGMGMAVVESENFPCHRVSCACACKHWT